MSPSIKSVASELSMPEREIDSATATDDGLRVVTTDGTQLLKVPDDRPDFEGKTGWMLAVKPKDGNDYDYPVYAPQPAESEGDDENGDGLDALDKDQLLALAAERGIEVSDRWQEKRLVKAIRAAESEGDDENGSGDDAS